MFREVALPAPFHKVQIFSLIEPVEETETETVFRNRLYMINRFAEGGRVLLMDCTAYSLPRFVPAENGEAG
ncbi:MAG: hypothetical protein ACK5LJ_17230 [Paracoccus sp. (in: a-proteobacteria)]